MGLLFHRPFKKLSMVVSEINDYRYILDVLKKKKKEKKFFFEGGRPASIMSRPLLAVIPTSDLIRWFIINILAVSVFFFFFSLIQIVTGSIESTYYGNFSST